MRFPRLFASGPAGSGFPPSWLLVSGPLLLVLLLLGIRFGFDEHAVFAFFRTHRQAHPDFAAVFQFFTDAVNPAFYGVFLFLLIKAWKEKRPGLKRFVLVWIAVQLAVSLLAVRGIKSIIGRPRPGEDPFFQTMTNRPSYHSLPSGHTTEAATTCTALGLRLGRTLPSLALGLLLALLGFSRVYLGWHHPSDVFFGWALGGVAGLAVHLFSHKE
ncbi:phosphatase PAP2 family protein [Paucidesulfovibrio longus]|uniref:phosphatase PAP2 family protein n=1 Tax=Paucidesulfovibrio longus TaxID=889 RepID=UPI0003B5CC87|nr:phosphatase PAP2 family protein [Paucidesulfovibrio longus]